MKPILRALTLATLISTGPVLASTGDLSLGLLKIQHQWAHISYQIPAGKQAAAFTALAKQADALVKRYPGKAEPLIWHGIVLSSLAGAEGGFGALHDVRAARDDLIASLKIDPTALQGSADASLGTLYYKVPGWPLGFGDDKKAETYLKKAIQIDPNGIVANYFYADYLYGQHRYPEALAAVQKALSAPARPNRPLADQGRRQQAQALLKKIRQKLPDQASTQTAKE